MLSKQTWRVIHIEIKTKWNAFYCSHSTGWRVEKSTDSIEAFRNYSCKRMTRRSERKKILTQIVTMMFISLYSSPKQRCPTNSSMGVDSQSIDHTHFHRSTVYIYTYSITSNSETNQQFVTYLVLDLQNIQEGKNP